MQEETQEYATEAKLRELVKRYSEFINFPIYLYESKEIDVPLEDEEESTPISSGDEIEDEGRCDIKSVDTKLPVVRLIWPE